MPSFASLPAELRRQILDHALKVDDMFLPGESKLDDQQLVSLRAGLHTSEQLSRSLTCVDNGMVCASALDALSAHLKDVQLYRDVWHRYNPTFEEWLRVFNLRRRSVGRRAIPAGLSAKRFWVLCNPDNTARDLITNHLNICNDLLTEMFMTLDGDRRSSGGMIMTDRLRDDSGRKTDDTTS